MISQLRKECQRGEGAPTSHAVRRKAMEICLGPCDWMPEVIMLPFPGLSRLVLAPGPSSVPDLAYFPGTWKILHIPPYAPVLLWLPNGLQTFTLNNYSFLNNWAFHWKVIHVHGEKEKKNRTVQIVMWWKESLLFTPVPQPYFSATTTSFWYLLYMSAHMWAYEYIHIPLHR